MNNLTKTTWLLVITSFLSITIIFPTEVTGTMKAQEGNLVFILDASGSMWGQVEGKAKIDIAKEVMTGLVTDLPEGLNVGLVAYGHRRKGDCNDVEELTTLGVLEKKELINQIKAISPKGKTPITLSVQQTAQKLKAMEDETTIILVSDGKETCEGDPCALVKELKQSGIKFVMHVIGFDVTDEEREQLECMAEAGGGTYYSAKNAGEFQMAARQVVEKPEFTGGILKVTAVKKGKPFKAWVYIHPSGEEKYLAYNHTTEKRPATFKLLPGAYDIMVKDDSFPEKSKVRVKGLEVKPGETLEKIVEFTSEGTLEVTPVKEGKMFKSWVYVYRQGEEKELTYKHTTQKRSASFKLLPGVYDIMVRDDSVPEKPEVRVKGLEVKPGETLEKIVEFTSEGTLKVTPVKEGKMFKSWVYVYRQGEEKELTYKHTTQKRSASFKLLPGVYDIMVRDDSVPEKPEVTVKGLEVKPSKTLEKVVEFTREGILEVASLKEGKMFSAWVFIYRQGEEKELTYKHTTEKRAASFKLLPGIYDIKVRDDATKSVKELNGVTIESGKTQTTEITF